MPTRFALAALIALPGAALAEAPTAEKEILDVVQKEWAAELKGDLDGMLKNKSRDVTVFDTSTPYRTDYATDNALIKSGMPSSKVLTEHMANPKVQVYGDTAILTYNFIGMSKGSDGKVSVDHNRATRVYVKQNGAWMMVHAHFSRATP
jgi:ketosteroid isomerase-like protein